VAEVQRVLADSAEPLTLSKIRAALRGPYRATGPDDLAECLRRQVAANVVISYPKYRSQQDRFWDRPMSVHIADLLHAVLEAGPLAWSEVRRKLPAYAQGQADAVLQEQFAQGRLYRHPRLGQRGKDRLGVEPPDPREYLRAELTAVFQRLEQLGFRQDRLRASTMELLQDEEWAPARPTPPTTRPGGPHAETHPAAEPEDRARAAETPTPPTPAPVSAGADNPGADRF
jgi:hypothetical protein